VLEIRPNTTKMDSNFKILIFEMGDRGKCESFRVISLLSCGNKLYQCAEIITTSSQSVAELNQMCEKVGFRKGGSCCSNAFIPK
jgi:hypothetical protein